MRYTRELTALVLAPIGIYITIWGNAYLFDATVALVASLALYEFLILGRHKGYDIPIIICVLLTLFIMAAFVLEPISVEMGVFLTLLVIPASYVFLKGNLEQSLPSSAIAVMATLYVGMLGGSLIRLRNDFTVGPCLVLFLLLVVWLGDAGAYYIGKRFGRRKLSPGISPNKTIEGFIGGGVVSMLTAAQNALRGKDFDKTQRLLKAAQNLDPNHPKVRSAIKGAEAVILADLHAQGLNGKRVPKIKKPVEEITQMNFTPNEGFILSRINGQWDIGSLMKISPIREPDAMLIFYRLWKDGIIAFD